MGRRWEKDDGAGAGVAVAAAVVQAMVRQTLNLEDR